MKVLSSSAIAAYKRCPKSYELGYVMGLEPFGTSTTALEQGSEVHRMLAEATCGAFVLDGVGMGEVVDTYLAVNHLPNKILHVEEPVYTEILPGVYIRTTFDLVYEREDGVIVGRDYKTFDRAPSLDIDLDFQGRIYIAALMRKYPGRDVEFEYEYIRRVPPGTKNSKGVWSNEECYLNIPLVISKQEAEQLWTETQWVVEKMLADEERHQFARHDLKVGPHSCGSCFFRDLCKAELQHGGLDETDLAILAPTRREPLELPKELT